MPKIKVVTKSSDNRNVAYNNLEVHCWGKCRILSVTETKSSAKPEEAKALSLNYFFKTPSMGKHGCYFEFMPSNLE